MRALVRSNLGFRTQMLNEALKHEQPIYMRLVKMFQCFKYIKSTFKDQTTLTT